MQAPASQTDPRIARLPRAKPAGGTILMLVAALALVVSNSPAAPTYFATLHALCGRASASSTGSTTG